MLDLNFIKENQNKVKTAIESRRLVHKVDVSKLLEKYDLYLDLLKKVETHRNLRNRLSEDISKVKDEEKKKLIQEASEVKKELQEMETKLDLLKKEIDLELVYIPNINSDKMPLGKDDHDNLVVKVWYPKKGYLNIKDFSYDADYGFPIGAKLRNHMELGELLDVIDVEQSGKVSGSRFSYIKNELAVVQDAVFLMLKKKLLSMGYQPMIPPLLVKERSLFGTSHFPEGKEQVYKIENFNVEEGNELFLVGSSEPANFSYFMDKVLEVKDLPIRIYAQTACFRSEVGSWGKDVKGIKRVHQFDKLEMNTVCTKGQEEKMFEEFITNNEWLLQQLELPYRLVNKCSGDCGYTASYYQYDWELWLPGAKEFMEGGTDTMTTDYQARRLGIRYRDGGKLNFARTINDTGVTTRILIAILENYQNPDGSVEVPKILTDYTGFTKILPKNKN